MKTVSVRPTIVIDQFEAGERCLEIGAKYNLFDDSIVMWGPADMPVDLYAEWKDGAWQFEMNYDRPIRESDYHASNILDKDDFPSERSWHLALSVVSGMIEDAIEAWMKSDDAQKLASINWEAYHG